MSYTHLDSYRVQDFSNYQKIYETVYVVIIKNHHLINYKMNS